MTTQRIKIQTKLIDQATTNIMALVDELEQAAVEHSEDAALTVDIPIQWRGQRAKDAAWKYRKDCGPTCAAMIVDWHTNGSAQPSPDVMCEKCGKAHNDYGSFANITQGLSHYDVPYRMHSHYNNPLTAELLTKALLNGKASIVLIKGSELPQCIVEGFHFIVISGYDRDTLQYRIHDPYPLKQHDGVYMVSVDELMQSMSGYPITKNSHYAGLICG